MEQLAPLEAFQRYAALGPDFLTWLLVRVLDDDLPAPPSEPGLKVDIQGPLVFTGDGAEASKVTLAGDEAAVAPEVISALRQGKKLARAKILLNCMEDQWRFTLDAETFDLRSLRVPVPPVPDPEAYLAMRAEAIMRAYLLVDELFEAFLPARLDAGQWREETAAWRKRKAV